jgi:hypothetical protein
MTDLHDLCRRCRYSVPQRDMKACGLCGERFCIPCLLAHGAEVTSPAGQSCRWKSELPKVKREVVQTQADEWIRGTQ